MKDVAGEWILVGGSEVDSGSYLSVAAPPDPLSTPSLTYWPSGGNGEVTLVSHASLDDTSMFNIAGIPAGTYDYYTDYADSATGNRVEYNRGSFTVHADGSVTVPVVTPPSDSPALVRSFSYQRVDRWGNVVSVTDPRSSAWSTTYTYNANNQVLENQVGTAVTSKYYDALGREVGSKDARGNVTRNVYDKNGNLGDIFYPDGGHTKNLYNLFGDRLSMAQTEGVTTNYAYDHLGRLTSTWAEPVTIYMAFADETGDFAMQPHEIATQPLVDHYTYDSKGRRTSFTNASGDRSTYGYDFDGNLITTTDALLNVTRTKFDAFHHKIAQVDANGNGMTWQVDEFGKVDSHVDLAGVRIDYGYDGMNQLRTQVSSERVLVGRQNLEFTYVGNLLTMIHDKAIGTITTYAYNKAGYRVRERTVAKDDYGHDVLAQNNFIEYDQQGRMTHVADGVFDVRIAYDLNGNRESVQTRFSNNSGVVNNIDERNTFDAMNRVRIANGTLEGASVVIGDKGHDIQYDKAGRRLSDTYLYKHAENNTTLLTTENFTYDGAGRLSTLIRDGVLVDTRLYDGAGRITRTGSKLGQDESAIRGFGMVAETRDFAYDRTGNVLRLKVRQLDNLLKDDLYYMAIPEKPANVGYDKVGNLIGYSVVPADYQPHTQYTNRYALFDSYKEEVVLGRTNEVNGSVTTHYDVNGNVVKVTDASRPDYPVARTFINDANGRALLKIDRTGLTRTLIVNGEVLGASTDEDKPNGFANVYQSAVSGANVAAPTIYEVQVSGETPMSIARSIWGDGNLWYLISDANGLGGNETLAAGTVVKVPGKANTVHNDYSTFKPYNPFDAIGSTTPTLPAPAAAEGCGVGGQLIMVVVAVIVTYLTAGQGTGPAWAAMSAMAGSIASQAVGIAIGAQEEFSWTSVAISAISAGVTHGVGALAETTGVVAGSTWQEIATRAMISNAATQGISNVVGLQKGFSWRSVAAAGAGAAVGKLVGEGIHEAGATFGRQIAERSLSGFAAGVTAAVMRGGKVTIQQVAIDAFGNALGSSVADAMGPKAELPISIHPVTADTLPIDLALLQTLPDIVDPYFEELKKEFALPGDIDNQLTRRWGNEPNVADLRVTLLASPSLPKVSLADINVAAAFDGDRSSRVPLAVRNDTSTIRAIGSVEHFFTFEKTGQLIKGVYGGVREIDTLPQTLMKGFWNLAQDEYGYAKQALLGPEQGVMGDLRPYEPKSSIVRSFQTRGAADTMGGALHTVVTSATGVSLLQALGSDNPEAIGKVMPGILLGGAMAGRIAGANRTTFAADEIRLSQSSVSFSKVDRATGQKYTYDDLVTSMREKGWQGDPVDLVRMPDGKLTSMDNTRITAAREARIGVQGVERSYGEALTPEIQNARGWSDYNTWGEAITARINNQSKSFSTANPYGSPHSPRIKGKQ